MAYTTISFAATRPTTPYDPDNPTQSTECLNNALLDILQDMEDLSFYINDGNMLSATITALVANVFGNIKKVFDYAKSAIVAFRASGDPGLSEPTSASLLVPTGGVYDIYGKIQWRVYWECVSKMYLIYYLWETEDDPLRIKDYIREMLLAWPLQDISIDLGDETGHTLKVYPQWNELDT